jgi:hypothetical protein
VPALDIDLFWHTHQLSSMAYLAWCTKHIGRAINHDNTEGRNEHSTGLDVTVATWQSAYSEHYLHPTPSQNAGVPVNWPPREPTTADKAPPPGLTPAQHRLWMEDVDAQREMEKHSFLLNQFREKLQSTERRIERLRNPATQAAAPAKSSSGLLSRLLRGPTVTPLDKLLKTRDDLESSIDGQARWYVERQQDFGRKKWPLLVAAMGWGDANVSEGKYARPPQGTVELGFPAYSGTWYGRTPLGYFDYFVDGGMAGGGVWMGVGMCAARFDGGNCVAAPVHDGGYGESGGGT